MITTDFSKRFPTIFTQSVQACAKQAAGERVQADVMTAKKVGRRLTTDALTSTSVLKSQMTGRLVVTESTVSILRDLSNVSVSTRKVVCCYFCLSVLIQMEIV